MSLLQRAIVYISATVAVVSLGLLTGSATNALSQSRKPVPRAQTTTSQPRPANDRNPVSVGGSDKKPINRLEKLNYADEMRKKAEKASLDGKISVTIQTTEIQETDPEGNASAWGEKIKTFLNRHYRE